MQFDDLMKELHKFTDNADSIPIELLPRLISSMYRKLKLELSDSTTAPAFDAAKISTKSASRASELRILGNKEYGRGKTISALKYYTKSIAAAPDHSEELAIAYANRSAVLLKLERFASSLLDVNRALQNNYPRSLKQKLYERKITCVSKIERTRDYNLKFLDTFLGIEDDEIRSDVKKLKDSFEIDEDATEVNFDARFPLPCTNFNNELVPNASRKIKINNTDEMGRHLVATDDIEPGEFLIVEKPYAAVLSPERNYTHCWHCFVRTESLIPCNNCSLVMYCGERCRNEAVQLYHRVECEILPILLTEPSRPKNSDHETSELLALRIVLVATKQGKELKNIMTHSIYKRIFFDKKFINLKEKYISEDYFNIHNLEDHYEKRTLLHWFPLLSSAVILLNALIRGSFFDENEKRKNQVTPSDSELFTATLLLKYLAAGEMNTHVVDELIEKCTSVGGAIAEWVEIGAAMCTITRLMNHSCDPNIDRIWYKNYIVCRAIKPITVGEQIFDYYGKHTLSDDLEERRSYLKKRFFFDCQCTPCRFNWCARTKFPVPNPPNLFDGFGEEDLRQYSKIYEVDPKLASDKHINSMCKYLSLMHKNIKTIPCREYVKCQDYIKLLFSSQGNYYYLGNDLIF